MNRAMAIAVAVATVIGTALWILLRLCFIIINAAVIGGLRGLAKSGKSAS